MHDVAATISPHPDDFPRAALPARKPVRARTREVRKMRTRVELLCEALDAMIVGELRGGDDFNLSRGSLKRRADYASGVRWRLHERHPPLSELARLVQEACKVGHRTGGWAKRQVVAAEKELARVSAVMDGRGVAAPGVAGGT